MSGSALSCPAARIGVDLGAGRRRGGAAGRAGRRADRAARHSAGGDRLTGWPADMRIIIRRENPHPARSCPCSNSTKASATRSPPPTPPTGRSSSSKPATEPRPEPKTRSAEAQAWAICPLLTTRSIPPGARPPPSPVTCWPGCGSSPWTATWPKRNQRLCVTRSCIPPGGSSKASAAGTENPAVLALGTRHRGRVHPHPRPAATLTSTSRPRDPKGSPAGSGTGAHPARQPGRYPAPGNETQDQKTIPPNCQARTSHQ